MTVIVVIVAAYLVLHFLGGMFHHTRKRRRGLRPNFYYSSVMGPYASIRIGGFRIGHRL